MVGSLFLAWCFAAGPEVELQPLSGDALRGTLARITAENVVVETADGEKVLPLTDVLAVQISAAPSAPRVSDARFPVLLVDGSRLLAESFVVADRVAKIGLRGGLKMEVPTRDIAHVQLRQHDPDGPLGKQWREVLTTKASGDVVVIRRSQEALDYLQGVLHDLDEQQVTFEFKGRKVPAPRERLEGLVYYHPLDRKLSNVLGKVLTLTGDQLAAKSFAIDGDTLVATTAVGLDVKVPFAAIEKLDFSTGNLLYLSDLRPDATAWRPFLDSPVTFARLAPLFDNSLAKLFQPSQDRDLGGERLLMPSDVGEVAVKGLGLHGGTELTYRLPEGFRRFQATAGVDTRKGEAGNVRLRIESDGQAILERDLRGKDGLVAVDLDVAGAGRLKIIVGYGDELDVTDQQRADQLYLYKARITK